MKLNTNDILKIKRKIRRELDKGRLNRKNQVFKDRKKAANKHKCRTSKGR